MANAFSAGFSLGFEGRPQAALINVVAHGFTAGTAIYFGNLVGGEGIVEGQTYYVSGEGLAADAFHITTHPDAIGIFAFTTDIISGTISTASAYTPITDPGDVMAPPVPPVPPPSLVAEGTQSVDADGKTMSGLVITVEQPADPTLRTTWVKITTRTTEGGTPDWTGAMLFPVAPDQTTINIPGVNAGTTYYIIAYSQSVYGDVSDVTDYIVVPTVKDTSAPAAPVGLTLSAEVRGFFAGWDADPTVAPAGDLAFYEVRYCLGGATDPSGLWTTVRSKTTQVFIGGLDTVPDLAGVPTAKYWVQVRAVDTTGNVLVSGNAVDYLANPNGGWCAAVSVSPVLVNADLVQKGTLNTTHFDSLDASIIKTGHLEIGTSDRVLADGILVYEDGVLVGKWDETGLYVYDADEPDNYVRVYAGGITVFFNGVPVTALDPSGLSATAITSGSMPGGGNLVVNSSFELADFQTPATVTWTDDVTADYNATVIGSNTNITVADALTMAAAAY